MLRVLTAAQMQTTDHYTIESMQMPAMVLMEKAAQSLVTEVLAHTDASDRILVVCGSGNNGADGMAAARMLHLKGRQVSLYLAGNRSHFTTEAALQWQIAEKYGVPFVNIPQWSEYTVLIDALFGTGLSRQITGTYAEVIDALNHTPARVFSMDIPSGVNASDGQIMGCAVRADTTVTFSFYKLGTLLYPGSAYCGKLVLADAGIYEQDMPYTPDIHLLEKKDLYRLLPRRPDGNKGTFGKVLLIAGSDDVYGAAYLSARAAFYSGAGMVKVLTSSENCRLLKMTLPEAMTEPFDGPDWKDRLAGAIAWADHIGAGPGLGTKAHAQEMVQALLAMTDKPLVLDADAINILAGHRDWLSSHQGPCILTPHMGEMGRLMDLSVKELKKDPCTYAMKAAALYQCILVLKDARTCIATGPDSVCLHAFGNSGMATAGSGDVLIGTILGLFGSTSSTEEAACLGVLLHGLAGDLAAKDKGKAALIAGDIIEKLPQVLKEYENTCI